MSVKAFLDTNLFVYCFDPREPAKQDRSQAIIAEALQTGNGIISTQVVQEFLNVALRKFAIPMKTSDAEKYLAHVLYPLCQVFPDLELYQSALRIGKESGFSFYESLILAGAQNGGCDILYSEDLQGGQQVGSVKIVNPFT